jgi:hypothetical protein
MVYPATGSILTGEGDINRTGTHVSTNIIIEVDGNAIGAVRQLSINEARRITQIDEVGTDGHIDSVPSQSTNITGSCQRTRFDGLRITAAFSRPFIHVAAQRIPFDLVIKDLFSATGASHDVDPDGATVLFTTLKNVWISKVSSTYRSDDFVIVDDMDWEAEHIYSRVAEANVVQAVTGGRQIPSLSLNSFEQAADRGDRRGALDGAGLLLAGIEGA